MLVYYALRSTHTHTERLCYFLFIMKLHISLRMLFTFWSLNQRLVQTWAIDITQNNACCTRFCCAGKTLLNDYTISLKRLHPVTDVRLNQPVIIRPRTTVCTLLDGFRWIRSSALISSGSVRSSWRFPLSPQSRSRSTSFRSFQRAHGTSACSAPWKRCQ